MSRYACTKVSITQPRLPFILPMPVIPVGTHIRLVLVFITLWHAGSTRAAFIQPVTTVDHVSPVGWPQERYNHFWAVFEGLRHQVVFWQGLWQRERVLGNHSMCVSYTFCIDYLEHSSDMSHMGWPTPMAPIGWQLRNSCVQLHGPKPPTIPEHTQKDWRHSCNSVSNYQPETSPLVLFYITVHTEITWPCHCPHFLSHHLVDAVPNLTLCD